MKLQLIRLLIFSLISILHKGDPDRVEKAELLTNEEAAKWRELKDRDTAKVPEPAPLGMGGMVCPTCGCKAVPWAKFCDECGQKFVED